MIWEKVRKCGLSWNSGKLTITETSWLQSHKILDIFWLVLAHNGVVTVSWLKSYRRGNYTVLARICSLKIEEEVALKNLTREARSLIRVWVQAVNQGVDFWKIGWLMIRAMAVRVDSAKGADNKSLADLPAPTLACDTNHFLVKDSSKVPVNGSELTANSRSDSAN